MIVFRKQFMTGHLSVWTSSGVANTELFVRKSSIVCLCWGFTAQATQWGHIERGQFT